ncbi:MAG: hypothetical protein ACYTFI_09785 [Planctomycetota bacterium]|jgi:hypothetical protein
MWALFVGVVLFFTALLGFGFYVLETRGWPAFAVYVAFPFAIWLALEVMTTVLFFGYARFVPWHDSASQPPDGPDATTPSEGEVRETE